MDYVGVLKRAWEITWNYRALWVFGIILALTTAGGSYSGGQSTGQQMQYRLEDEPFEDLGRWLFGPGGIREFRAVAIPTIAALVGGLCCVGLLFIVAGTVARHVAEVATIQMVHDYERTGEKRTVREGFKLGWSRSALRIFLIGLVISVPTAIVIAVMFVVVGAPALLWLTENTTAGIIGTIATVALFFPVLFLVIAVGTALNVLQRFFWRACVLEGLGVLDAIREGFGLVRRHLKEVGVMWLIMVGLGIAWVILFIPVLILLLPVLIVAGVVGLVLGGVPAVLLGLLASLLFEGAVPWILAAVLGLPIFFFILGLPMLLVSGLVEVFKSSVWTLTYGDLHSLDSSRGALEAVATA
jgi:hypothetical protein